jgi:predicted RNA-binding protein associated with RNAse of E/G family
MKINKDDLKWAATQGLISTEQAEALWEALIQRTNEYFPKRCPISHCFNSDRHLDYLHGHGLSSKCPGN